MSKPTGHNDGAAPPNRSILTSADRRTLDAMFRHPMPHNLEWADIVALCGSIGTVEHRTGDEYAFRIGAEHHAMRKPHAKDLDRPEVIALRHLLARAGWSPEPSQPAADPDPAAPALLVAMDHRAAKIYRIDVTSHDLSEHVITPYDPHDYLHHLTHKDQDREHGQRAHEDAGFYEQIAQAIAAGGRIVVVGHGKGHSNSAHHLVEYLQTHHRSVYGRTVIEVVADLSSLTDPQLLELARNALLEPIA